MKSYKLGGLRSLNTFRFMMQTSNLLYAMTRQPQPASPDLGKCFSPRLKWSHGQESDQGVCIHHDNNTVCLDSQEQKPHWAGCKVCSLIWRCNHTHTEGGGKHLQPLTNRFYSLFSRCQLTAPTESLSNSETTTYLTPAFHTQLHLLFFPFDGIFFKARLLTLADHPARPPRLFQSFFSSQLTSFAWGGALP